MKTTMNVIAGVLVLVGIAMAAGAGGDCDGKCMEYANTLGETIMYGLLGLVFMATGAAILIANESRS